MGAVRNQIPMSHYKTNEQIAYRKWKIDEERREMGWEPMYAKHEKSDFNPDAPAKRKKKKTK